MNPTADAFPVSWKERVTGLPPKGRAVAIRASQAERGAIARFGGVAGLPSFEADLVLAPARRGGVLVRGTLRAEVVQTCVVSLLPVESRIEAELRRSYAPETEQRRARGKSGARGKGGAGILGELVISFDDEDPPEPFAGNEIDLAGLLVEEFLLALDPYPRHPEAKDMAAQAEAGTAERESDAGTPDKGPFAGLAAPDKPGKRRKT